MQRADAQGTELQLEHALLSAQPQRNAAANGRDGGNTATAEARERVSDQTERGLVEPLQIVDAEQERTFLRKLLQCAQEPERDETVVDGPGGFCAAERSLQRLTLRSRQVRESLTRNASNEVNQARERVTRFSLRRPAGQCQVAVGCPCLDGSQPERRLPDAGVARDHRH
jgi:hypothetical protein